MTSTPADGSNLDVEKRQIEESTDGITLVGEQEMLALTDSEPVLKAARNGAGRAAYSDVRNPD